MVRFYDPKDKHDLARIEALLKRGGIEYSIGCDGATGSWHIRVAEEDIPQADELVRSMASARH